MLFSEVFNIPAATVAAEGWFDPILDEDTLLFIDPFLVHKSKLPLFLGAQDEIVSFFERVFRLAAGIKSPSGPDFETLAELLEFPEVRELCLGYANSSIKGVGTGKVFAHKIAASVMGSVELALVNPQHFEVLSLFQEGIGPDRISDMAANVLKPHLITYTQAVCRRNHVPMEQHRLKVFDYVTSSWKAVDVDLATNPLSADKRAVLLFPDEFLNHPLTANPIDFSNFLWDQYQGSFGDQLSFHVKANLKAKRNIVLVIRKIRETLGAYQSHIEGKDARPYDLNRDPKGVYSWDFTARSYVSEHEINVSPPSSPEEFRTAAEVLAQAFKSYIEAGSGVTQVWNMDRPKSQEAVRRLFQGIVSGYCTQNGVEISRTDYLGKRPVTFTYPNGFRGQVLFSVKLLRNPRLWKSFESTVRKMSILAGSLPAVLLVIGLSESDLRQRGDIHQTVQGISGRTGVSINVVVVNATQDGEAPVVGSL